MRRPTLVVSIGCPAGIGPEVSVVAASSAGVRVLLVGDPATIAAAARLRGVTAPLVSVGDERDVRSIPTGAIGVWAPSRALTARPPRGAPTREAGAAQLAWVDEATRLVATGAGDALVTGPVSKHAIATSGARGAGGFLGHTEHLASRLGAREVVMAFWAEELVTALVTTHLPLAKVSRAITPERVSVATYWLTRLLRAVGVRRPLVAVASLNPHAGEGGLLGSEEGLAILPGIERARRRLEREQLAAKIVGPLGAETALRRAAAGEVGGVVAMYHDQATIPQKLLSFGDAVNVTLGLPIVRTSVDHGTAYDAAWRGRADGRGMTRALELAARLARSRRPPTAPSSR